MDDVSISEELAITTLEGEEILEDHRTLDRSFHICTKAEQTDGFNPQR